MEKIRLNRAILHILDSNHASPIISVNEMHLERDISEFLEKHITRVLVDGELKKAYFQDENNFIYDLCNQLKEDEEKFREVASKLANRLFAIMKENPSIPSADIICCIFETNAERYLALIKFNYKNSYIHYIANTDEGNINTLIKQKTTLPNETQKVEECMLINLNNLELKLLEKSYEICGEKENYLSKYFLECTSDLSNAQKLKILDKTVSKLSKKHFNEDFNPSAKLRTCLLESIEEDSKIIIDKVAETVFGNHNDVRTEYIEEIKKAGLIEEVITVTEENTTSNKFSKQKLKTDSGIEINFPAQFYNNNDIIEFINNPDGTISILIKNVNKLFNK